MRFGQFSVQIAKDDEYTNFVSFQPEYSKWQTRAPAGVHLQNRLWRTQIVLLLHEYRRMGLAVVAPVYERKKEAARCHICNSGPVQRRNQGGAGSELRGKLPSNPAIPTNLQPVRSSVRRSAFACALVQLCTSAFSGSCMLIAGSANAQKCATFAQNQCSDLVCMAQRRQPGSLTRKGGAKESNKRARRKARRSFDMPCALV